MDFIFLGKFKDFYQNQLPKLIYFSDLRDISQFWEIDSELGKTEIRSDTVTFRIDHNLLAELHNESKHRSECLTVLEDRLMYFASKETEQLVDELSSIIKLPNLDGAVCWEEEFVTASNIQNCSNTISKVDRRCLVFVHK